MTITIHQICLAVMDNEVLNLHSIRLSRSLEVSATQSNMYCVSYQYYYSHIQLHINFYSHNNAL